eukprot:6196040-Amphidinium_carterae.1
MVFPFSTSIESMTKIPRMSCFAKPLSHGSVTAEFAPKFALVATVKGTLHGAIRRVQQLNSYYTDTCAIRVHRSKFLKRPPISNSHIAVDALVKDNMRLRRRVARLQEASCAMKSSGTMCITTDPTALILAIMPGSWMVPLHLTPPETNVSKHRAPRPHRLVPPIYLHISKNTLTVAHYRSFVTFQRCDPRASTRAVVPSTCHRSNFSGSDQNATPHDSCV